MRAWILYGWIAASAGLFGQPPEKYSFEVVSIKAPEPSDPNQVRMRVSGDPGMVHYSNLALRDLIAIAYGVKTYQIEGPDWMESTRFEIQGKVPAGVSDTHIPDMVQTMLAERFGLVTHRETKDHAVLALVAEKSGAKLKPAENPIPVSSGSGRGGGGFRIEIDDAGAHVKATSATLTAVADTVSRFSEKPVVDQSGIEGQYDFDLVLSPSALRAGRGPGGPTEESAEGPGSLADAFLKYGLKLEPRKAPMPTIVVDHLNKAPTAN